MIGPRLKRARRQACENKVSSRVSWLSARPLESVGYDDGTDEWVFDFGEGHVLKALLEEHGARIE
jgi:hypothetical protein